MVELRLYRVFWGVNDNYLGHRDFPGGEREEAIKEAKRLADSGKKDVSLQLVNGEGIKTVRRYTPKRRATKQQSTS